MFQHAKTYDDVKGIIIKRQFEFMGQRNDIDGARINDRNFLRKCGVDRVTDNIATRYLESFVFQKIAYVPFASAPIEDPTFATPP
jgi:hypothetical protein